MRTSFFGPDIFYRIEAAFAETLRVSAAAEWAIGICLVDDCETPTCLAGGYGEDGRTAAAFEYVFPATGTYYLVVDGVEGSCGPFELTGEVVHTSVSVPSTGEPLARVTPIPIDAVNSTGEGEVCLTTPPDPRTGERELRLDPLDWIHALCQQIPDPRQHLVRYYGLYANRSRSRWRRRTQWPRCSQFDDASCVPPTAQPSVVSTERCASWARILRKIFEVDPLLCPTCQVEMRVVSVITEPAVVDKILRHLERRGGHDPFEKRAPPDQAA